MYSRLENVQLFLTFQLHLHVHVYTEIIHVGFNKTSVSVEEGSGNVTLCVVIMSGNPFRLFGITVYTLNNTAGLCSVHVVHANPLLVCVCIYTYTE